MRAHTSVPKDLVRAVRALERHPLVKKVHLGPNTSCGHKQPVGRMEVTELRPGGFRAVGWWGGGKLRVFVQVLEPATSEMVAQVITYVEEKLR